MFRTHSLNPRFHESVVSANTEHDHFGLYVSPSDTRAQALINAVEHLLQQTERTGARLSSEARVLVATGGRLGPAKHIASRIKARVVAACSSDSAAASAPDNKLVVVRVASPDDVFNHDDATFDVVISVDAFSAADNKSGLMKNAFRVLKEGGILAIMDIVARPAARRENLAPFEKAMGIPSLITLHSYTQLLQETGFVLMRTFDLSAHVVMSYRQVIAQAYKLNGGIHDVNHEEVIKSTKQLEDDIGRMRECDTIGWTSLVALKKYEDERDGKLTVTS